MVTVALAGATTGFGLTMLRIFLEHNSGKHKIVLLSRSGQPELVAKGVDVRPVDYTNHPQLVKALDGVHTLLSVIGGSMDAMLNAQLALIEAAKEAGVMRFAPSEYAGSGYAGIDLYQGKAKVWEATQMSGLEYTRFTCGIFTSILATGTPKPVTEVGKLEGAKTGEEEALAGLRPWNFVINMRAGTADLPGDGSQPVVFTDMRDVARLTFAALDLATWPKELGMRGDIKPFAQVVEIVERVQGRKFLVRRNSLEQLEAKVDDLGKRFYNQCRVALAKGWGLVNNELNEAFPEIEPVTMEEFAHKWWSGVELDEPSWTEDVSHMD